MKFTDGLWLQISREVAEQNTDIEFEDRIVDNLCMQLVQRPEEYDVLVLPNLYGDIVSDLAAGLIGGLGLAPGGNIGTEAAVFEPTHGSAPKYAGQNKVNPMAMMLSGRAHAPAPRGGRRCRPARAGDRRRDRRGQERHLRHEAVPRRSDRRRDERRRGRDHREAGGDGCERAAQGDRRRSRERRRDVRAGARAPRLRGRRARRHQGGPARGQGARHQPGRRRARLRAVRDRLDELRRHRRLGRRRRSPQESRAPAT